MAASSTTSDELIATSLLIPASLSFGCAGGIASQASELTTGGSEEEGPARIPSGSPLLGSDSTASSVGTTEEESDSGSVVFCSMSTYKSTVLEQILIGRLNMNALCVELCVDSTHES